MLYLQIYVHLHHCDHTDYVYIVIRFYPVPLFIEIVWSLWWMSSLAMFCASLPLEEPSQSLYMKIWSNSRGRTCLMVSPTLMGLQAINKYFILNIVSIRDGHFPLNISSFCEIQRPHITCKGRETRSCGLPWDFKLVVPSFYHCVPSPNLVSSLLS